VSTLGLIPARGDSRGVPRKNLRTLGGKPLVAWAIESAKTSSRVDRVVASTDDDEIADVCRRHGAEVPFLRPAELARDETPDRPVYDHALEWLAEHADYRPDAVVWLRPTAPLREPHDVDAAVDLLLETDCDCVRSVCAAEHHPLWMRTLEGDRLRPLLEAGDETVFHQRQLLPPVYRLNGAVDVVRSSSVTNTGALFGGDVRGYVMPAERSVDLDSELDFAFASLLLERRGE
jgi:CMP-N,N'-diacetyllegionaminic acid synthase